MTKLRRHLLQGHCYHVASTTHSRLPVFAHPAYARVVADALHFLRAERAYLLAYVVMPDHVHAVLVPREPYSLSSVMQSVKGYSARIINAKDGRRGPLWQQSFYDRVIRDEQQLLATIQYIHWNPVDSGLATVPEEYEFSSAYSGVETDLGLFV